MTETPDIPSAETLTMVELKDRKTNQRFAVFNTHLTFSKIDKRDFQARFIAKKIREICKKIPVVLTGDFNTFPHRLDLEKLPFYDGDFVNYILTRGVLQNARDCSLLGHLGPISTFTNHSEDILPFKGTGTPGVFLDHIYVNRSIRVLIHAVQPSTVNGHFPSDHMPVMIDFIIPTRKTTKPKHKQDVKEQNTLENAQKEK
jgi:endonuclease/exonuclease/phosphatase family metal-dependent hydrolase